MFNFRCDQQDSYRLLSNKISGSTSMGEGAGLHDEWRAGGGFFLLLEKEKKKEMLLEYHRARCLV